MVRSILMVDIYLYIYKPYTQILEYCIHCKGALRANLGKVCLLVAGLTICQYNFTPFISFAIFYTWQES